MKLWRKRLLVGATVCVGLVLALAVTAVLVVQSDWFWERVRLRIISEVERVTGGQASIDSFGFNWRTLEARVEGLTLRGTEPADGPPLFHADAVVVGLKVISAVRKDVDIALLAIDRPSVYIVFDEQGRSNLPGPGAGRLGDDPMAPLLKLAIRRLEIRDGLVEYDARRLPLSVNGDNVRAEAVFDVAGPRYRGELGIERIEFADDTGWPPGIGVEVSWTAASDSIGISSASVRTAASSVDLSGVVDNLRSPVWAGQVTADLAVSDLVEPLGLPLGTQGRVRFEGRTQLGKEIRTADGRVTATDLAYRWRRFGARNIGGSATLAVDGDRIALRNLAVAALGATFEGSAELRLGQSVQVDGDLRALGVRSLAASAGVRNVVWTGGISGPVHVAGTLSPRMAVRVDAEVVVTPRAGDHPVEGAVAVHYDQAKGSLEFGPSRLQTDTTQLEFSGVLREGIAANLETRNLEDLLPALAFSGTALEAMPVELRGGTARFEGQVAGILDQPRFQGRLVAGPLVWREHDIERLAGDVTIDSRLLRLENFSVQRGRTRLLGNGTLALENWRPLDAGAVGAEFSITGADVRQWLREVKREYPLDGTLSGAARLRGTYSEPELLARVHVDQLVVHEENVRAMDAEVRYSAGQLDVDSGRLDTGAGSLTFQANYQLAGDDWSTGELRFNTAAAAQRLVQWKHARDVTDRLDASVAWNLAATVELNAREARLSSLTGEVTLDNVRLDDHVMGNARLTASNRRNVVVVRGDAALHDTVVGLQAEWSLVGDSFGLGQITFSNLTLDVLRDVGLFGGRDVGSYMDVTLDGEIGFTGPILNPATWQGMAKLTRLEMKPTPREAGRVGVDLTLRNSEPLLFAINNQEIRVQTGRLQSADTDLNVSGTLSFRRRNPWNLRLRGTLALSALRAIKSDLVADGNSTMDVVIRGSLLSPQVNGRLEFENASFYLEELPNGLEQVNGAIVFDRTRATVERFTSRTGGGELRLAGFVLFGGDELVYRLQARASRVRVRYPEGVSTVFDANLNFTGTSARSMLSGEVTVTRAAFDPNADIGSVLAEASRPTPPADITNPFLRGMGFDIRVLTAGGAEFMTSLTRDIEIEADLQVRGGPARPIVIGRLSVNQGEITFFGNRYTIAQGEIRFFNPAKIEPVIAMDLETRVRGYTVMINFTGPLDKLNFSYRSDPPLQSREIIALLAVGRAPESTRNVGTSATAGESFLQAGGNTLLGQALSAPVSNRLQRFFGVSRIKIDPQLTGVENTPETRITIEQQLSREITLTYVTNLARTQQQIVRVEWNFHPEWSVYAVRDSNGVFGMDFVYRRRF